MRIVMLLALLGTLAGGAACHGRDPAEPSGALHALRFLGAPQYKGPIVQVDSVRSRVLLQYRPAGINSGQMWFTVQPGTPVFAVDGSAVAPAALRPGMQLRVWSRQVVLESDPGQTGADAILIGG